MNAAEHIVEAHFRHCCNCFTLADKKVLRGNNRQFDLPAYNLKKQEQFHIEVSVTHREYWCLTIDQLKRAFERKFIGAPPERTGKSDGLTDYEKGKSYLTQIEEAYSDVGFDPNRVSRVWVCWTVKDGDNTRPIVVPFESQHLRRQFLINVWSLRDYVLPALWKKLGTANYDDEILRALGIVKEWNRQTARPGAPEP